MIPLGITLGVVSKAVSSFGLVLQKLAHTKNSDKRASQRVGYVFNPLWVFGFAVYVGGNAVAVVALTLAPQSIIGAMDALVPVFNAIYAPRFLGEEVGMRDWAANSIILMGVALVVAFGPRVDGDFDLDELVSMLYAMPYLAYALSVISFVFIAILLQECGPRLHACSRMTQKGTRANRFAAVLAGIIPAALSGFNQQLSKVFGNVVGHVFDGEDDLAQWESWFFIVLLLLVCLVEVNRLQKALQEHISLVVVPVFQVGIVVFSVAGGGLYFREFEGYDGRGTLPPTFFGIGLFLSSIGVFAVTGGRQKEQVEEAQRRSAVELAESRPSKRWTLPIAKGDMSEGERLYLMAKIPNPDRDVGPGPSPAPGNQPPVVEGTVVGAVLKDNTSQRHRTVRSTFGGEGGTSRPGSSVLRSVERRISLLLVPFGAGAGAVAALQSISAEHTGPAAEEDPKPPDSLDESWVVVGEMVEEV
eukprot:Hpha_TRINITY_DN2378_c0_g1::TRINITY_DN2378_c0_g1_i1::g.473::m.473